MKQTIGFVTYLFFSIWLTPSNAAASAATTTTSSAVSLSESLVARVRSRQLGQHHHPRKLMTVDDPTIVLDGQYIMVFNNDTVPNVTAKVESLFMKEQILYEYDNIAMKGAAIRNVSVELIDQLEEDSDILFIAPVCTYDV
jgi:hypothetical protein